MHRNLIHVGFPKTATTWFQYNFYPNVTNFHFCNREEVKKKLIFNFSLNRSPESFDFIKAEKNILCEEMLIGSIQNAGIHGLLTENMALKLKKHIPQAEIILFIRNQFELIRSSYMQDLRTGGNLSMKKFLFPKRNLNLINQFNYFSFAFFEFDKIIDFYKSGFGSDKVHVFLYEEFRDCPAQFISTFAQKFEMDVNLTEIDYFIKKASFPGYFIPVIRFLNTFTNRSILNKYYLLHIPKVYGLVKKTIEFSSGKFSGRKDAFSHVGDKKITQFIDSYYKGSNQKLIELFGQEKLIKFNYPL